MNILKAWFGFKKLVDTAAPVRNYYDVALREIAGTESVPVLSGYASDYSGYVRQAALKRCAVLARPELLPVVAGRLNDWVPQVRHAARTALMALMPFLPVPQLMAALPVILRLHSEGRGDYSEWLAEFEKTLLQIVAVSDICTAARSPDIKAARAAVHLLDKYALLEPPELVALMLARNDDIVLALNSMAWCEKLDSALQRPLYVMAVRSHFGAVRTAAIRALLNMPDEEHRELAVAALMDGQSSVRSLATHYLIAAGVNVPAYYRDVLVLPGAKAKHLQISLAMLASLRDAASLPLIKTFTQHAHATVRASALSAWFKLAEQDKDAIAQAAMQDISPRVLKLAGQLVLRHGAYIPFPAILRQLAVSDNVLPVIRLAQTNRWNWLECVARACLQRGAAETHRSELTEALEKWLRGTQWQRLSDQQQRLFLLSEPVMAAFGQLLSPQSLASLRRQLLL